MRRTLKRVSAAFMAAVFLCAAVIMPCSAAQGPALTRAEFLQRLYEVYLEHGGATIAEECYVYYDPDLGPDFVVPGGFGSGTFFDDVDFGYDDASYMLYELTGWASPSYRNITNGAAEGRYCPLFFPDRAITYREAIVMIYRLVMSAKIRPQWRADISADDVPAWAADAATWWLSNIGGLEASWKDTVTADAADTLFEKVFQERTIEF